MHPDTEPILAELRKVPAFRAQEIAAKNKGISVDLQIARCLERVNEDINTAGANFFRRHPSMVKAPYAVFLLYNIETCLHDVAVMVGNAAISALRHSSVAQIMNGGLTKTTMPPNAINRGPGYVVLDEGMKDRKQT